jgi:hypothetical protein
MMEPSSGWQKVVPDSLWKVTAKPAAALREPPLQLDLLWIFSGDFCSACRFFVIYNTNESA